MPSDHPVPYGIGSDTWPGLSRLAADAAQVVRVACTIIGTGNDTHQDAAVQRESLQDELGDLRAAIDYVIGKNALDWGAVNKRRDRKRSLYERGIDEDQPRPRDQHGQHDRDAADDRPAPHDQRDRHDQRDQRDQFDQRDRLDQFDQHDQRDQGDQGDQRDQRDQRHQRDQFDQFDRRDQGATDDRPAPRTHGPAGNVCPIPHQHARPSRPAPLSARRPRARAAAPGSFSTPD